MKKLKILRAISGVDFSFMGNEEVEMDDKNAASLLDAGFAVELSPTPAPEKAATPVVTETATSPWKKKVK